MTSICFCIGCDTRTRKVDVVFASILDGVRIDETGEGGGEGKKLERNAFERRTRFAYSRSLLIVCANDTITSVGRQCLLDYRGGVVVVVIVVCSNNDKYSRTEFATGRRIALGAVVLFTFPNSNAIHVRFRLGRRAVLMKRSPKPSKWKQYKISTLLCVYNNNNISMLSRRRSRSSCV